MGSEELGINRNLSESELFRWRYMGKWGLSRNKYALRESPESRDQAEGLAELIEMSLIEERKVNDLRIEALERIKDSKTEIGRILKSYE